MKKIATILLALFVGVSVSAQKKDKINGNKVVTHVYKTLNDFHAVEISDNLKVNITQTRENGYHLKTDVNLVDVIKFDIVNGVLKIYTTRNIRSKKELEIDLTFANINRIALHGDAELVSKNRLDFADFAFKATDDASYELDVKANDATFDLDKNSKGDIMLKGERAIMILNGNAYLKGDIVSDNLNLTVNKRADMSLKGDVENLKLTTTGSSDIRAKKLKTIYADLNTSNSSDVYVYASKELKVYTQGKSYVYVYGNPEITVDGLNDKSKIIKK